MLCPTQIFGYRFGEVQKMPIIHTSAYKFISLSHLEWHKQFLYHLCFQHQLLGSILLAEEGFNLALAGEASSILNFKKELNTYSLFADLFYKDTSCARMPFQRLFTKIKQEIVPAGFPGLYETAPESMISPLTLQQWYEQGIEFDIIDTRNDYEVSVGTFHNAHVLPLKHFRNFSEVVTQLEALKSNGKPKVIFCTGGIRCEKALPVMQQLGFDKVYQLQGGILNYFKQCGGRYYQGECFVFDERVSLDFQLNETKNPSSL
jgi:UPF0176 protein